MRLLVISDTHGKKFSIVKVLRKHEDVKHVAFLGDMLSDLTSIPELRDRTLHVVRGNCDFGATEPVSLFFELEGKKIFICHGHEYNVKWTYDKLINAACAREADLVLFGHTHTPVIDYINGLHIVNPGSLGSPRSGDPTYAIIDISAQGILPNLLHI